MIKIVFRVYKELDDLIDSLSHTCSCLFRTSRLAAT